MVDFFMGLLKTKGVDVEWSLLSRQQCLGLLNVSVTCYGQAEDSESGVVLRLAQTTHETGNKTEIV